MPGGLTHTPLTSVPVGLTHTPLTSVLGGLTQTPPTSVPGGLTHTPLTSVPGGLTQTPPMSVPGGTPPTSVLTHTPLMSVPGGLIQTPPTTVLGGLTQTPPTTVLGGLIQTPPTTVLGGLTQTPPTTVPRGLTQTPLMSVPGGNADQVDPYSLPLSTYFSLPLSSLMNLVQSALSPPYSANIQHTQTSPASVATHVPVRNTSVHRPPRVRARPLHSTSNTTSPGSWSSTLSPVDIAPFTQPVGPTVEIPTSELEVFSLFFTEEICSYIMEQSNLYAEQILGEKYEEYRQITVEELKAYFGFKILMGLYPKPAMSDYWRRDPFVHYAPIADRIPRDRFFEINRFLHFANNTELTLCGDPGYDRLGKVRPVMEMLQERFLHIYHPHCENAIDEAMIPFQGRSSLKQYMPAKPVKRGIKVWCRADSHNGYLCEFQVYTGRSESAEGGLGLITKAARDGLPLVL